jgi:hypothetical protein
MYAIKKTKAINNFTFQKTNPENVKKCTISSIDNMKSIIGVFLFIPVGLIKQ